MDFLKSTPALDKVVNESTTHEDLREALKSQLVREGRLVRDPETQLYGSRFIAQPTDLPAAPTVTAAPQEQRCFRVIYPHLNDRVELHGVSEEELNVKEISIRAAYGGQR